MTIKVDGRLVNSGRPIDIGVCRDNLVTSLEFEGLPELDDEQTVVLYYTVNDGEFADGDTLTQNEDGAYVWDVTSDVTTHTHDRAQAYLCVTDGTKVWNSQLFTLRIHRLPTIPDDIPAPETSLYESLVASVTALSTGTVKYSAQTKTTSEKLAARQNIGAANVTYDSSTETLTISE